MVCLLGSGNSSTRRPFARRYSVMPSTVVIFSGGASSTFGGGATGVGFGLRAAWPTEASNTMDNDETANTAIRRRMVECISLLPVRGRGIVYGRGRARVTYL